MTQLKELERKEQERKVQLFQIVVATTDCVRRDLSVAEMGAKLARLETGLSSVAQELKELRSALDFSWLYLIWECIYLIVEVLWLIGCVRPAGLISILGTIVAFRICMAEQLQGSDLLVYHCKCWLPS